MARTEINEKARQTVENTSVKDILQRQNWQTCSYAREKKMDTTEVQRNWQKWLYTNQLNNLEEMNTFLGAYSLPRLGK